MVMVSFLCAFIFTCPIAALAVSVDAQASVIRREVDTAILLSADGEIVNLKTVNRHTLKDFCANDYPKGVELTNKCDAPADSPKNHTPIIDQASCRDAATEANVDAHETGFIINEDLYPKRPWGCYAAKCHTGSTETCYFFNGADKKPANIEDGTPVCKRPKFANGTATPNDVLNGCPTGYGAIMHPETCRKAGICMGKAIGAEFRVGELNASQHHDHPIGCFINLFDGKVYFNFVETGFAVPETPEGIPICNVTDTTSW